MAALLTRPALAERAAAQADKVVWWIMGALAALLVTIGGALWAVQQSQLQALAQVSGARGERIAALEARSNSVDARLASIDAKLDRLIDAQVQQNQRNSPR